MSRIVFYTTSCPTTVKVRADCSKLKYLLDAKNFEYEEVDLSFHPYRRLEMLNNNDGDGSLPQLHVNGRPLGTVDEIQEWEDWGELSKILGGASPGKLAADAAAKFVAEMQHQEQQQQHQKLRQQSERVHPES